MRSLLLKIHIYAGLICSSYLLIFGISSLNYNYNFGKPGNEKVTWKRSPNLVNMENNWHTPPLGDASERSWQLPLWARTSR